MTSPTSESAAELALSWSPKQNKNAKLSYLSPSIVSPYIRYSAASVVAAIALGVAAASPLPAVAAAPVLIPYSSLIEEINQKQVHYFLHF